jgi:putative hydroxymethylpyrimidine transport system substrate-binding protein
MASASNASRFLANPTVSRRALLQIGGAAGLGAVLAACSSSNNSAGSNNNPASGDMTTVRYMIDFLPNIVDTWLYVALAAGYYRDEGINVQVMYPPDDNLSAGIELASVGKVDIAYGDPFTVATARQSGAPILAVANEIGVRADGIVSLAKAPVHTPQDLVGKTLAAYAFPQYEAEVRSFLRAGGVSPNQVTIVYPAYTPPILAAGKAQAAVGLFYGERIDVEFDTNQNPIWVNFTSYGLPPIPQASFVTSETFAKQHKDVLEGFIRASTRGIKKSLLDNPAANSALQSCCSTGPNATGTYDDNVVKFVASEPYWLAHSSNNSTGRYGVQDLGDWNKMLAWAEQEKLVTSNLNVTDFVTNEFVTPSAEYPTI